MEQDVDSLISRFRNTLDQELAAAQDLNPDHNPTFVNPQPGSSALADHFLCHLNLQEPGIDQVLTECYPQFPDDPRLQQDVRARVRFIAWMTLKHHPSLRSAYNALTLDTGAQRLLGFTRLRTYQTLRDFVNTRLRQGDRAHRLAARLLALTRSIIPDLGLVQAQDAFPCPARRRDTTIPYNDYYKARVHKVDARWDTRHHALLTFAFYRGLCAEGVWVHPLTKRVRRAGITKCDALTVDGGYPSLRNIALSYHDAHPLQYRHQEEWVVNAEMALDDVHRRYKRYWKHSDYHADAPLSAQLRFLITHGTPQDLKAVGRFLRDHTLTTRHQVLAPQSPEDLQGEAACAVRLFIHRDNQKAAESDIGRERSLNEGLNPEFQRVLSTPRQRGARTMYNNVMNAGLTLLMVQLTRAQNGVAHGLCRTANIV